MMARMSKLSLRLNNLWGIGKNMFVMRSNVRSKNMGIEYDCMKCIWMSHLKVYNLWIVKREKNETIVKELILAHTRVVQLINKVSINHLMMIPRYYANPRKKHIKLDRLRIRYYVSLHEIGHILGDDQTSIIL